MVLLCLSSDCRRQSAFTPLLLQEFFAILYVPVVNSAFMSDCNMELSIPMLARCAW